MSETKRKVLFITNIPAPYRLAFFNELGKKSDLTVLFEGAFSTERDEKWKGEEASTYRSVMLKGVRVGTDRFIAPGVRRYLREKWDHIIVSGYSTPTQMIAIQYMRRHKIPFLMEIDGGFPRQDKRIVHAFKKHFISSASAWFSTGAFATEYLTHYGADPKRCFVYPFTSLTEEDVASTRDLALADREKARRKLGIASDAKVILTVGRFSYLGGYGKGYDAVFDAAEKLGKDVLVYIVGGEPTEEFAAMKESRGLNQIRFVGFCVKDELKDYYLAADLFVLMTVRDVWGLVINESMLYHLPVITTTFCGAGVELIQDGENGYLIPVGDSVALADKSRLILADPALRQKMGENSYRTISRYTLEKMAEAHLSVLEQIERL